MTDRKGSYEFPEVSRRGERKRRPRSPASIQDGGGGEWGLEGGVRQDRGGFLGVPANRFASRPQGEVTEGCRLPVLRRNQDNEDEWRK